MVAYGLQIRVRFLVVRFFFFPDLSSLHSAAHFACPAFEVVFLIELVIGLFAVMSCGCGVCCVCREV